MQTIAAGEPFALIDHIRVVVHRRDLSNAIRIRPAIDGNGIKYSSDVEEDQKLIGNDGTTYYALTAADAGSPFQISDSKGGTALAGADMKPVIANIHDKTKSWGPFTSLVKTKSADTVFEGKFGFFTIDFESETFEYEMTKPIAWSSHSLGSYVDKTDTITEYGRTFTVRLQREQWETIDDFTGVVKGTGGGTFDFEYVSDNSGDNRWSYINQKISSTLDSSGNPNSVTVFTDSYTRNGDSVEVKITLTQSDDAFTLTEFPSEIPFTYSHFDDKTTLVKFDRNHQTMENLCWNAILLPS